MFTGFSLFILGIFLGIKHALDADHIAAVSTIVAQEASIRRSSLIGAFWGVGHSLTLILIGVPILLFRWRIPESVSIIAESAVGIVLIALGISLLQKIIQEKFHIHRHVHQDEEHAHFHSHIKDEEHAHVHFDRFAKRSLLVGVLHGLAGSGALALLILTTMPTALQGVLYLCIFSLGTLLGMTLLTTAMGIPFSLSRERLTAVVPLLSITAGVLGTFIGLELFMTNFLRFWKG